MNAAAGPLNLRRKRGGVFKRQVVRQVDGTKRATTVTITLAEWERRSRPRVDQVPNVATISEWLERDGYSITDERGRLPFRPDTSLHGPDTTSEPAFEAFVRRHLDADEANRVWSDRHGLYRNASKETA